MLAKRLIVSLPVGPGGRLNREVSVGEERAATLRDAGRLYAAAGIDELVLEVGSTTLPDLTELVERISAISRIPISVIGELDRASVGSVLAAGAVRAVVGAAALEDPDLISVLAKAHGSQGIGVQIDAVRDGAHWRVLKGSDGEPTEWDVANWARVVEAQGGGEIYVRSKGAEEGDPFDLTLLQSLAGGLQVPLIARGEPEDVQELFDALMIGDADGVVAGRLFHSGSLTPVAAKAYLAEHGLSVRAGGA